MAGRIMSPGSDMILPPMILPPIVLMNLLRRGAMSVSSGGVDQRCVERKRRLACAVHGRACPQTRRVGDRRSLDCGDPDASGLSLHRPPTNDSRFAQHAAHSARPDFSLKERRQNHAGQNHESGFRHDSASHDSAFDRLEEPHETRSDVGPIPLLGQTVRAAKAEPCLRSP
jgi:hypothetical protein